MLGAVQVWPPDFEVVTEIDFATEPGGAFLPRTGWVCTDWDDGGTTATTGWQVNDPGDYLVQTAAGASGEGASHVHYDTGSDGHEVEALVYLDQGAGGYHSVAGVMAAGRSDTEQLIYIGYELVIVDSPGTPENKEVLYFRSGAAHDEYHAVTSAGLAAAATTGCGCASPKASCSAYRDGVLFHTSTLTAPQIAALAGHTRCGPIEYSGPDRFRDISIRRLIPDEPEPGVPTISSVTPSSGLTGGGTTVTLTGTNFVVGATTVSVGGNAGTSVSVASTTSLTFLTPAGTVGAKSVTVTTSEGTSAAATFTYTTPAAPTLTNIAPSSGPPAGGTTVTLTGTGFVVGATSVTIGADTIAAASVIVASATSLTFTTPGDPAGAVNVTVTTANGTSGAVTFTYSVATATITEPFTYSNGRLQTVSASAWLDTGTNVAVASNQLSYAGTNATDIAYHQTTDPVGQPLRASHHQPRHQRVRRLLAAGPWQRQPERAGGYRVEFGYWAGNRNIAVYRYDGTRTEVELVPADRHRHERCRRGAGPGVRHLDRHLRRRHAALHVRHRHRVHDAALRRADHGPVLGRGSDARHLRGRLAVTPAGRAAARFFFWHPPRGTSSRISLSPVRPRPLSAAVPRPDGFLARSPAACPVRPGLLA